VIASLLSQETEETKADSVDRDSPVDVAACGKMDLLPLSVEVADA